ncbi:MAG TPA: phosphotransferase [Ktedonobacteraceae bacterium]
MHEHEHNHEEGQQSLLELDEVMRAFGVKSWSNLGSLESGHAGELLQLLMEIEGKRYVLRERPEGLVAQEGGHHYAFQRYLIGHGIPIAPLWETPQGEPYVLIGDGNGEDTADAFELQEWVEGELFANADARESSWISAAGEMLGRIHQASRSYLGPQYRWPSEVQAGGLTQGWLNFARGQAEQCEVYAITAALSNLVDAWERALPAAMMAIGSGRGLPELHIHGDYSALNLRFTSRGVSQVLGLEASRWEKRLLEVAYGVFYFAGLRWEREESLTRPLVKRGLDPIRAGLFLRGYASVFPPVPGEAELLVDALTLVAPIITANGPLEDLFYQTESLEDLPLEDMLERLAWAAALPNWLNKVRRSFAEMWK